MASIKTSPIDTTITFFVGNRKASFKITYDERITEEERLLIPNEPKMINWIQDFCENICDKQVHGIHVRVADWFGPKKAGRLGFINMVVDVKNVDGSFIPGITFIRGGAIAVLVTVTVTETGEQYYILTKQYRTPVGKAIHELPAGMLDGNGDFAGVAANELREEAGINVPSDKLRKIGHIYPSPGGCDEDIILYSCDVEMSQDTFQSKKLQRFGLTSEGEDIRIVFIKKKDIKQYLLETPIIDAKLTSALYYHSL